MKTYRTSAVVKEDGTVVITNLPFREGEELEAILRRKDHRAEVYPLRGEQVKYKNPFDGVAEDELGRSEISSGDPTRHPHLGLVGAWGRTTQRFTVRGNW